MSSELQRLAELVRQVGDQAGPVRGPIADASLRASKLAEQVPSGVPSASRAASAMQQAGRSLAEASRALDQFSQSANRFASRLAGGGGGGGAAAATGGGTAGGGSGQPAAGAAQHGGGQQGLAAAAKRVLTGFAVSLAIIASGITTPMVQSAMNLTNVPNDVQDSAIELVEHVADAVHEGVEGQRDGEDAAEADPVAKPDYSDTSPPPKGNTFGLPGSQ